MSVTTIIAESQKPLFVDSSEDDAVISSIWFKTEPFSASDCYRIASIQLCTDSNDQGWVDNEEQGSWSWFELAVFENADATAPRMKSDRVLSWRSHTNRIGYEEKASCFGVIFDRRTEILDDLEPGNVIAVMACTRFPCWQNKAHNGVLWAKIMNEELFSPMSWTLPSREVPDIAQGIKHGVFTITPNTECHVKADSNALASRIWFASPPLDQWVIQNIEDVQLFAISYGLGPTDEESRTQSWSWFDIVILETPTSTEPKIKGGRSLVWSSHSNPQGMGREFHDGKHFKRSEASELLTSLEPGNVLAVRVCAKFAGRQNHAYDGRLVICINNSGERPPAPPAPNVEGTIVDLLDFQNMIDQFLRSVSIEGLPSYESATSGMMTGEVRADDDLGAHGPPLRLLALDGGGVRGVSTIEILRQVMVQITGDQDAFTKARPCDYFDMIAGTSTGGLIAIMLGRLHMTLQQCAEAYDKLAKQIFDRNGVVKIAQMASSGSKYDASLVESGFKEIIKKYSKEHDEETSMFEQDARCKVFVMTVRTDGVNKDSGVPLRTYENPKDRGEYGNWPIWKAARATSAAPTFFHPMEVGDKKFVDGGLGFNNPLTELVKEAVTTFGVKRPIGCILSIGTGIPVDVNLALPTAAGLLSFLKDGMVAVATSCERAHRSMGPITTSLPLPGVDKYFRFNVGEKIGTTGWLKEVWTKPWFRSAKKSEVPATWEELVIDMDNFGEMNRFVMVTAEYMKDKSIGERVAECAAKIKEISGKS